MRDVRKETFIRWKHQKIVIQDCIDTISDNPSNRQIKEWIKEPKTDVKGLLYQMRDQGFISIEMVPHNGRVKRILKNTDYIKQRVKPLYKLG